MRDETRCSIIDREGEWDIGGGGKRERAKIEKGGIQVKEEREKERER